MSSLSLRVNANFRGSDLIGGTEIVGNIYSTDRRGGGQRNVLIPVGDNVEARTFDLEPGNYAIEAMMPSGVILTGEATLAKGEARAVDLNAQDSPHESHSWQYLAGNLESAEVYHSLGEVETPRSHGSMVLTREQIQFPIESATLPTSAPAFAELWWIPDSRVEGWAFENLNLHAREWPSANFSAITRLMSESPVVPLPNPTESDGRSHLYRFDRGGPVGLGDTGNQGARRFALIEAGGDAFLATLPAPWIDVHQAEVQVEIMVSTRQNPTGSLVAVTVRDRVLGPAIAYLGNGALTMAAELFANVEEMLYGKVMNPLAAAAGAYVLVGTDLSDKPRRWHPWVQNLGDWFGWLSDGAILWGTLQLRTAASDDQSAQAKQTFKDAFNRGVPFYTLGLRWLIDGLSEFPDDPQCELMLKQARELSWRVDMRQPFVILRMNGRHT